MVKMEAVDQGNLNMAVSHMSGAPTLVTSAPLDNGGDGKGFSPTDLLGASLVSCILTTMALKAKRMGFSYEGASGQVEKHMVADPLRRVGRLVVKIKMPVTLSPEQYQSLVDAGRNCPVALSLSENLKTEIHFS
ncbi:MAG: OsmC family protein [Pseudomonadota bacterium]